MLGRAATRHPALATALTATLTIGGAKAAIAALAVVTRLEQPEPLLRALGTFASTAELQTVKDLHEALPRYSLVLARTSISIADAVVARWRDRVATDRATSLPDLATSVNNLAIRLGEAGRRTEGLTAAQEAVALRRELTELNRDAYLPDLAATVHNLANRLGEAGRRAEGLTAAQEAVALRRELTELNRDAYLPDLAATVHNLANRLGEAGRRAEGLTAAQVAANLRRELAAAEPRLFGDDLALSEALVDRLTAKPTWPRRG